MKKSLQHLYRRAAGMPVELNKMIADAEATLRLTEHTQNATKTFVAV